MTVAFRSRFVLTCGYDVHVRNDLQETPLHVACRLENFQVKVARVLLEAGAQLYTPDLRDICPQDILSAAQPHVKFSAMPWVTLKCLAARAIIKKKVPFNRSYIPQCLSQLIDLHVPTLPCCNNSSDGESGHRCSRHGNDVIDRDSNFGICGLNIEV